MHRVDTIVSSERDKIEDMSHVKQAHTVNGCPEWLTNSITAIQSSLESTASVSSDDTSDDVQETAIETAHKKPTSKKSPVVLPYIQGVW